ncbi:MAG: hypothetical protein QXL94_02210 [Candidatus Parvarchaeum sp.]
MKEEWVGFLDYKFDKPLLVEITYQVAYVDINVPELEIGGRGFEMMDALMSLRRQFEVELKHNTESRWSELRRLNGIREKVVEDSQ